MAKGRRDSKQELSSGGALFAALELAKRTQKRTAIVLHQPVIVEIGI